MGEAEQRPLGVVEAISAVRDQCPHAAVRDHAARALADLKGGGPEALREQAFLVLRTIVGWRGPRANAVRRALEEFVAQAPKPPGS